MSLLTLEIARNALTANQLAMDVSAQNVANANTPGYVRQRALLSPLVNATTGDTMLPGLGVQVAGVQRLRNQCLETQINHQEGLRGQDAALARSLRRVESYFPDLDDSGIATTLGQTFDALQRLQTDPGSDTARAEVLLSADAFCTQVNEAERQLSQEELVLEGDLGQTVDRANQLLHQIAELNGKVVGAGQGPGVNDLRVSREEAIRELAGLCGALGMDQSDGSQDVLIGGVRLVQGAEVTELSLAPDPANPLRHTVAVGDLAAPSGLSGQLAGDLGARDTQLASWRAHLDELASTFADAFNALHGAGYDLNGNAGGDFFTYDAAHPAATLSVSATLVANPSRLAAAGAADGGAGDGRNAAALANLRATKLFSGGLETVEEFHGSLLYQVGAATSRAEASAASRDTLVQNLDTQYNNEAGVSLDEEAVDVMRYQQAYSASAKLVQVALQMMDDLLEVAR